MEKLSISRIKGLMEKDIDLLKNIEPDGKSQEAKLKKVVDRAYINLNILIEYKVLNLKDCYQTLKRVIDGLESIGSYANIKRKDSILHNFFSYVDRYIIPYQKETPVKISEVNQVIPGRKYLIA